MEHINYGKKIELRYETDVLVAGGGPAGCAAAVMCARQTIVRSGIASRPNVMILEQSGTFGGASILSMVSEIMNFDDGIHFLSEGFGREIHEALFGECKYKREWYTARPEELKRLYDKLIIESGVKPLFYSKVVDSMSSDCDDGKHVDLVVVSDPSGLYAIKADCFIDCTGNASLCLSAGAEIEYGDSNGIPMSSTLCSMWGGVDFGRLTSQGKYLNEAFKDGVLSQYDTVLPGIKEMYTELGIGGGNIGHCFGVDDRSAESLTDAMFNGRKSLAEYEQYYRKYVDGCENSALLRTADWLGIRESRRVVCETVLTADRFFDDTGYEDEVGRYSYPIDIHPMTPDTNGMNGFSKAVSNRHEAGHSYSIPYRCLIPKGFLNLLVAGRCVGADHEMEASVRVIPGCYITGQAAGIAAAVIIEENVSAMKINFENLTMRIPKIKQIR